MRLLLALLLLTSSVASAKFEMTCQQQYYNWQYVLLQIKVLKNSPQDLAKTIPQDWSEEEKEWARRAIETATQIPDDPAADYRKYVKEYVCKQPT